MQLVLFLTLIEVAFGMALIQCFIPRRPLGPGFAKVISATIFFCLLPPAVLVRQLLPSAVEPNIVGLIRLFLGAALALWFAYFVALNYARLEKAQTALALTATLAQITTILLTSRLLALHYGAPQHAPPPEALFVALALGIATAGFLLGSVTMAMLIGHWYLVIPGLPIVWLKGACAAFGAALLARLTSILFSLAVGAINDPFGAQGFFDRLMAGNLLVFPARLIVGLALPAAFCFMAWRAASIRATQSSTGILFPAMIIVFMGEMIGSFLVIGLQGLAL